MNNELNKMKKRLLKQMEYADAPSGSVLLYNYKEPFMRFEQGFGFQGTLLFDEETQKIQCHFCGEWYGQLAHHLHREHNMTASAYKEEVGLLQTTALINEETREKLIASGLDKRLQNLRQNSKKAYVHSEATRKKIRATLQKNVREQQNLRGTCPEQLLHKLKMKALELGRTPKESEFTNDVFHMLRKTFGSMQQACALVGLKYRIPGQTVSSSRNTKWTEKIILDWMKEYYLANSKLPMIKEMPKSFSKAVYRRFNMADLKKKVLIEIGKFFQDGEIKYTKDELLFWLWNFEKVNGRRPACSDAKRGLLPYPSRYIYHFGSWNKALALAFN